MSESALLEDISRWKRRLDAAAEDGAADGTADGAADAAALATILEGLAFLQEVPVDRRILQETKLGLTLGRLRKHKNPEVAAQSKKLVASWKSKVSNKTHAKAITTITTLVSSPDANAATANATSATSADADADTAAGTDKEFQIPKFPGPFAKDVKRDKAREVLFLALYEGVGAEQRQLLEVLVAGRLIAQVESALHDHYMLKLNQPKEYSSQLRSIKSNLGDPKNPEFNARLYLGGITPEVLATMASAEMASDAKKKERQKTREDLLEECQSDWNLRNISRASGQFPCGRCRSDNTTYFQMQTRSSDEPMTTYVTCHNCGHRWKF